MAPRLYLLQIILFISISHAFIHTHTIIAFVFFLTHCSLFISVFFFVSFAKFAAGISFLSYWSQSAKKREDIRMERVRGGIIPSFNWFQTFSPLGDLLPEL